MERFCSDIYEIEELFDIKEVGATSPVECRLNNGSNVIAKYPMNPAGNQVLFNEMLGFLIADIIGVNIPKYGICNLSAATINTTNQNEEIDVRNKGKCFYSQKIGSTVPPNRSLIYQSKYCDVEKVILLDYILHDSDRHIGNILCDINTGLIYVIDFSHIISTNLNCDVGEIEALSREENKKGFVFKQSGCL